MSALGIPCPDVYAIPIDGRWLLYAPGAWTCATVNRAAVERLARVALGDPEGLSADLQPLWQHLTDGPGLIPPPADSPEKLVIIPTRACNMQCVYCDFGAAHVSRTVLDPRVACRVIDDHLASLPDPSRTPLRIHFFGGEPLVARACVETIVHYARARCARTGATPWFEVTTNGVFDAATVPFVGDYLDSVVISLDGDEALHDYNRRRHDGGGTYATIAENIRRLSQYPVETSLRMCVTDRSVGVMAELAARFLEDFDFEVLGFEMLVENESCRKAGLSAPDPCAFAAGVLKSEPLASRHGVRVVHGPSELAGPRTTSCPFGRGTLMLTPDARLTTCYLETRRWEAVGLDCVIGKADVIAGVVVDREKQAALAAIVSQKPRCARCFCRHTCAGGCHVEQTPPGCSLDYDNRCRAIRMITAARLLRTLDGPAADAFAASPAAMRALADHPDDRLASRPTLPPRRPS